MSDIYLTDEQRTELLREMEEDEDYRILIDVLLLAYKQAAFGKGRERHANGKPFHDQPLLSISDMVGSGYPLGQAVKKLQESRTIRTLDNGQERAVNEVLGAINYAAAAAHLYRIGKG